MWKKRHVSFLTQTDIDLARLISVLKQSYSYFTSDNDKKILETILKDFENKNFSLLNTQEIQYLTKNSEKKWAKYLIHRHKFNYYEDHHILPDFPIYLLLEPVSACNLRCPFCHQIDDDFTSNQQMMGKMDLSLFKKIIDEAHHGGTQALTLTCRGEPTLHPQIGEMIIDSRPSDAIAIALRTHSPIYVSDEVMGTAGIDNLAGGSEVAEQVSSEELKKDYNAIVLAVYKPEQEPQSL